jgi:hypothetical protein
MFTQRKNKKKKGREASTLVTKSTGDDFVVPFLGPLVGSWTTQINHIMGKAITSGAGQLESLSIEFVQL